jgi:hypothetical protein
MSSHAESYSFSPGQSLTENDGIESNHMANDEELSISENTISSEKPSNIRNNNNNKKKVFQYYFIIIYIKKKNYFFKLIFILNSISRKIALTIKTEKNLSNKLRQTKLLNKCDYKIINYKKNKTNQRSYCTFYFKFICVIVFLF